MRSYQHKSTGSHQNFAVKRAWARVVLGWVTSWEVLVLHPYFLPCASNRTSPSILFFLFLASNTLRARAAATGPSSERCHRRGPPLVAGRRGPVTLSRSLEIDFSSNCRENNHPRAHNCSTAEENNILIFFLPQRRKRAKC